MAAQYLDERKAKRELSTWTRTGHGIYVHADGRKVRRMSNGYVRYDANGTRLTPACSVDPHLLANW
jgi:hypothetical protein